MELPHDNTVDTSSRDGKVNLARSFPVRYFPYFALCGSETSDATRRTISDARTLALLSEN
jgi:hypothetical protein